MGGTAVGLRARTNAERGLTRAALEVLDLLTKLGPLSLSQISVELGWIGREVLDALKELQTSKLVEQRPDRDEKLEAPWGLARPHFRF